MTVAGATPSERAAKLGAGRATRSYVKFRDSAQTASWLVPFEANAGVTARLSAVSANGPPSNAPVAERRKTMVGEYTTRKSLPSDAATEGGPMTAAGRSPLWMTVIP